MLVGDLIVSMRELGPDPCQVISWLDAQVSAVAGGSLTSGTYFVQVTALTPWGESVPNGEAQVTLTPGTQKIQIVLGFAGGFNASLSGARVYIGTASGAENFFFQFPLTSLSSSTITVDGSITGQSGTPPPLNRAYLPDTDGGFCTAATVYRWLNESLKAAARATGGIQDTCGIASVSGMRRYVAPGQWLKFDQCFYDGWELDLGNKAETFRNRNLTANISISLMVDAQSDTTRIELYWTPSRTSGSTTTSGTLLSTDTNVAINAASGWLLADGLVQVGSEILTYSAITGTQLQNVIRGWNGTAVPASLGSGAPVKELNIEITGYRMPATYSVGQSAVTLGVPPGWEPFLKKYMLGLFRDAEQERQEAQGLMKEATDGLKEWAMSNKPVAGPRQCRMYGDYGIRGLVPGGLTGGIIIP